MWFRRLFSFSILQYVLQTYPDSALELRSQISNCCYCSCSFLSLFLFDFLIVYYFVIFPYLWQCSALLSMSSPLCVPTVFRIVFFVLSGQIKMQTNWALSDTSIVFVNPWAEWRYRPGTLSESRIRKVPRGLAGVLSALSTSFLLTRPWNQSNAWSPL